jgi:acetyl esterase
MNGTVVDPAMQAILIRQAAQPAVRYDTMPAGEGRLIFETLASDWNRPAPDLAQIRDVDLHGATGPVPVRLYRPEGAGQGLIIGVHGGGWTFGSLDSHDRFFRLLALDAGLPLLAIDYRLAPEHPFPAGRDDVLAVIEAVLNGSLTGIAPRADHIVLAGDSAGAHLALAALIARRDSGAERLAGAALFYGCFAPDFETESHRELGDGAFGLSTDRMRWYWGNLLGEESPDTIGPVAPLRQPLHDLPPLYLNAAGLDPLRDDTLTLSARLARAGVAHRFDSVPGVIHGFMQMSKELPAARTSIRAAGDWLRNAITAGTTTPDNDRLATKA